MVLFQNFVDIAACNAFVCFLANFLQYRANQSHRRRLFLEELAISMMQIVVVENPGQRVLPAAVGDAAPRKRARCVHCPREVDKKTTERCFQWGRAACKQHLHSVCLDCQN